jgi:hypothetical protein
MFRNFVYLAIIFTLPMFGCWSTVNHEYSGGDGEEECEAPEEDPCADIDAGSIGGTGQGCRPDPGYEDFGGPCTDNSDCTGYDRARCIPSSILGVIAVPGGFCTACCDKAGEDCATGLKCIGYDDVYLVCAATCTSDDQCNVELGYACRPLNEVTDNLVPDTQTYCLPDEEHQTPDPNDPEYDIQCDWPWLN